MSESPTIDELLNDGLARFAEGDFTGALSAFEAAITRDASCARAWCARGMVWHRQGEYEKALSEYENAIRLDGRYARAYFNCGVAKLAQGDAARALFDQ